METGHYIKDISEEEEKSKGQEMLTVLKYCAAVFLSLIGFSLLFIVNVLLLLTFYFSSGKFRGTSGWIWLQLISIFIIMVIVVIPTLIIRRRCKAKPQKNEDKHSGPPCLNFLCFKIFAVCLPVIIFFLSQVMLWLVVPRESFLPLEPRNLDALSEESVKFRPVGCDIIGRFNETTLLFKNSDVDFTDVRVLYGGSPGYFETANAMVLDKTIYLALDYCPSVYTLVHEAVHIWQFQKDDIWFSRAASVFFEWILLQSRCRDCPYDYGGFSGLQNANASGHTIKDFGVEMQAMIVENYYFLLTSPGGQGEPDFPLLEKFALQVLSG